MAREFSAIHMSNQSRVVDQLKERAGWSVSEAEDKGGEVSQCQINF